MAYAATMNNLLLVLLLTISSAPRRCHAFLSYGGCGNNKRSVELKSSHDNGSGDDEMTRRRLLNVLAGSFSSGPVLSFHRFLRNDQANSRAAAMGLVQFPCKPGTLMNNYHLMRAGQSGLEEQNILSTNPLFLTNTEDGLTSLGKMQVEDACRQMVASSINPSVIKYSLASKCIDTANTIANTLMVGRNRIVPEFTFMDPRGAGHWNGRELLTTEAALFALDAAEAGNDGRGGRPPPTEDGTANETLFEQVIRLRQLMSILETQYSGDDILLIFPDGTSPALLSCLIAGLPLKDVHAFNFQPGEIRMDVDFKSTLQSYASRKVDPQYKEALAMGKEQLEILRKEESMIARAKEEPSALLVPSKAPVSPSRVEKKGRVAANDDHPDTVLKTSVEDSIEKRKAAALKRRQAYVDESFAKRNEAAVVSGEIDYPLFSDYMPVASLGAIASMTFWRPDREEDNTEEDKVRTNKAVPKTTTPSMSYINSTAALSVMTTAEMVSSSVPENTPVESTTMLSSTTIENRPMQTIEVSPNVFEERPVLSKEERIAAANQAMEEYLSKDDGGDDWLMSIQDILTDE